jgi:hypothetical protein
MNVGSVPCRAFLDRLGSSNALIRTEGEQLSGLQYATRIADR